MGVVSKLRKFILGSSELKEVEVECPNCGGEINLDMEVCPNCGTRL
ncbi:MAG: zinc ribbon domain-containing protein [Halobacteria archaeon]|nr:zinc ribbon domain-containing protein [Halobacteria archaeon]